MEWSQTNGATRIGSNGIEFVEWVLLFSGLNSSGNNGLGE
jgi:hypothetical protein